MNVTRAILASSVAALLTATPTIAASLTWDLTPGTAGPGDGLITGGTGSWDTTTALWTVDGGTTDQVWNNANNDVAIFDGTAGTVTLSAAITANALNFNVSGYVITANTLTLAGPTPTITLASGQADTIQSVLAGTGGLVVAGGGNLTLTNFNTYTGGTTVNGGSTLTLGTANSGTGTIRGTLTINAASTVVLSGVDALGYSGNYVNVVNVNGGTINNATTGNNAYATNFFLTGGTMSSTGGGRYNFDANNGYGITTLASSTSSVISAPILIRTGTLVFNVAAGTVAGGADLAVTGVISQSGTNGITKNGNGVMSMGVASTYTGGTTINGGILDLVAGGGGTGVIRGTATVNTGTTLRLSTGDALGYNNGVAVQTLNVVGGTVAVNSTVNQTFSNMSMTLTGGSVTGIPGSNIDIFSNTATNTAINSAASANPSIISVPTLGLRQNDTIFTIADGAAAVDLRIDSVVTNGSANQGNHNLVKNGTGNLQFTAVNTFTGTTRVNNGTLSLNGTAVLASPTITIAAGALFDVSGLSAGSFLLATGQSLIAGRTTGTGNDVVGNLDSGAGTLNVAGSPTPGTLTVGGTGSGNLTLSGGTVNFDLANVATVGGGVNDLVKVNNLTLTNTTNLAINKINGALASATYTLINYTGTLTGNASNLTLSGAAGGTTRQTFTIDTTTTPGSVLLKVAGNSANLVWAGDDTLNVWDIATTANFKNGAAPDKYFDGDSVTFDDTGSNSPDIVIPANVAPGVLVVNNTTKNYNFSGANITGGTGLTKNGSGSLLLVMTGNTFTGPMTINNGTVGAFSIANSGVASSLGAGTAITLGDATHVGTLQLLVSGGVATNRTITVNAGGGVIDMSDVSINLTASGAITLNGPLTKSGNGTLTLPVGITGPGALNITGGTVAANAFSSFTGNLNITGGATFTANIGLANGVTTAVGAGSAARTITVGTGSTMTWTVNNIFQGGGGSAAALPTIVVDGGTFNSTRFNVVGNLVLNNGATLVQNATDGPGAYEGYQFIGTVTVGGTTPSTISSGNSKGNHLRGGATTNFIVADVTANANADLTVSNVIKDGSGDYPGVGTLQKSGPGTMLLTAAETYTGATNVTNGVLALSGAGHLASPTINVSAGATLDVSAVGGYTFNTGLTPTAQTVNIASGGALAGPSTVPVGSTLIAGHATGTNTDITGDLTSLGTLFVGGTGAAGTLKIGAGGATPGSLFFGSGTVNFDLAGTTTIGGGVNDLIIAPGDLYLPGNTTINILPLTGGLSTGNYTLMTYAGTLFGDATNLTLTGVANTARQTFALSTATAGSILLQVTGTPGNLVWVGNGTTNVWDHTTANIFSGPADNRFFDGDNVTFNDTGSNTPAVQLTGSLVPSAVTFNNSTKDYTIAGTGSIDGATGITKNGTGTLTISSTNNFTGTVAINSGTVAVSTMTNGGAAGPFGTGTSVTLGDATHTGTLQLAGTGLTATTNRILTLNAGGGAVSVPDATSNLTVTGIIGGVGSLTKTGNGTLTLSAANTFSGGTIVNGGALTLTVGGIVGTLSSPLTINTGATVLSTATDTLGYGATRATTITINGGTFTHTPAVNLSVWGMTVNMTGGLFQATNAGGRLDFGTDANAGNVPTAINTFASTDTATIGGTQVNLRQANTTFTVADGVAVTDLLVSAPINEGIGGAGITKAGPGTMVLSAGSSYTGPTVVNAGTLLVTGTLFATSPTNVLGGTLGGTGTAGLVNVSSGAKLAPGVGGPGLLTTNGLTMVGGAVLNMEINSTTPATGYDRLSVVGTVDITDATLSLGGTYNTGGNNLFFILLNDGVDGISGTFNGLAEGGHVLSTSGQDFVITYQANGEGASFTGGNDIALMAVPEPAAGLALLGGLGALLMRRRRR